MANRARARSTWAAGALSERLRRVSSWRSSAVSGRRGSFRWRDMGHLGARGSPHHYTSSHGRRPTSASGEAGISMPNVHSLLPLSLATDAYEPSPGGHENPGPHENLVSGSGGNHKTPA